MVAQADIFVDPHGYAHMSEAELVRRILRNIGLMDRELEADADHLPKAVKENNLTAELANSDRYPVQGFGLIGPTGTGKTMAMSYLLGRRVAQRVAREFGKRQNHAIVFGPWRSMWVNWPDKAEWLRRHGFGEEYEAFIEKAKSVSFLMIDDIGAERVKGDASNEDFARFTLSQIVDTRHRDNLNTWYTSNLNPQELLAFYSDRAISRLLGDNRPIIITGRDQRLRR